MDCRDTQEHFSDYYDGELPAEERGRLDAHLTGCATCRGEYQIFRQSLDTLHKSGPMETTAIFVTHVKAAAQESLERKELYVRTEEPRVEVRKVFPLWMPWVAAAGVVIAFVAGMLASSRREPNDDLVQLRDEIERLKLKERPQPLFKDRPELTEADKEKILEDHGLIRMGDQWVPKETRGRVLLDGKLVSKEDAFSDLAKTYGKKEETTPTPAAFDADVEFQKRGYQKADDIYVPRSWLENWQQGQFLTGPNAWKSAEDYKKDFMKEHHLVEDNKIVMTKEQFEERQAKKTIHRPETGTANVVTAALEGLEVGPPLSYRNLTLTPILSKSAPRECSFTPLHSIFDSGKFEIAEMNSPFAVKATNGSDSDVLLISGDILVGGRYARIVTEDTLVSAKKAADVRVYCVEPGTLKTDAKFAKESGFYFAPGFVRRIVGADLGQGAVWTSLSRQIDLTGGKAKSQAEVYKQAASALAEFRTFFADFPERNPEAIGVAVSIGDRVAYVELFLNPSVFTAYFERVLAAAGLEAELTRLDNGGVLRPPSQISNDLTGVRRVLESVFFAALENRGDERILRRDNSPFGRALLGREGLAHLLVFAEPGAPLDWRGAYKVPKEKLTRFLGAYNERIKTGGPIERLQAITELASISLPEATAVLAGHLNDTDISIRKAVIVALGSRQDPLAVPALLDILKQSVKETALFTVTAAALARIGDEKAVDPFLKQLDGTEPEPVRIILGRMAELLLQIKNRELLEKAVGRLISLHEDLSAGMKGDPTPTPKLKPADVQALSAQVRSALEGVTGHSFDTAAAWREWWNRKENREQFLRDRLK